MYIVPYPAHVGGRMEIRELTSELESCQTPACFHNVVERSTELVKNCESRSRAAALQGYLVSLAVRNGGEWLAAPEGGHIQLIRALGADQTLLMVSENIRNARCAKLTLVITAGICAS